MTITFSQIRVQTFSATLKRQGGAQTGIQHLWYFIYLCTSRYWAQYCTSTSNFCFSTCHGWKTRTQGWSRSINSTKDSSLFNLIPKIIQPGWCCHLKQVKYFSFQETLHIIIKKPRVQKHSKQEKAQLKGYKKNETVQMSEIKKSHLFKFTRNTTI